MFSKIFGLLDVNNCDVLCLFGCIPKGFRGSLSKRNFGRRQEVASDVPLRDCLQETKAAALVSLFSIGTVEGMIQCPQVQDSTGIPSLVAGSWWEDVKQKLHLFFFCCYSHEYLSQPAITAHFVAALGYEGKVWIRAGEVSEQIEFLSEVAEKIVANLRKEGRVDQSTYASTLVIYGNAILADRKKRGCRWNFKPDYLTRLCLVKQSEALKLIDGGVL